MIISDQLRGARGKLTRADQHVRALQKSIRAFHKRNPDLIVRETSSDKRNQTFKVNLPEHMPIEWSMMIGDCAHNLRSALDYLICEAVIANGRSLDTFAGFPIVGRRRKLDPSIEKKAAGASEKTHLLIHRLKPYRSGNLPFWLINELNIIDKHKAIIPVWAEFPHIYVNVIVGGVITGLAASESGFPANHGSVLAFVTTGHDADVDFTLQIAFVEPTILRVRPETL